MAERRPKERNFCRQGQGSAEGTHLGGKRGKISLLKLRKVRKTLFFMREGEVLHGGRRGEW